MSKEFDEKREIIELAHKLKMEELEFARESDRLHHEREMERQRIKTAEIRKAQMRRFEGQGGGYKY
jgi:hypothetical protein